jgi:hypothetical protein
MSADPYGWWNSLKHGGLLIAPSKLAEYFPDPPPAVPQCQVDHLRRNLTRLEAGADGAERSLLGTVLESLCGFAHWEKGNEIGTEWTQRAASGEAIKPRWLWQGTHGAALPVFVDREAARIGIGRGRRTVSRTLEWLRGADRKLALVTNLRQWRLVYAGLDFDAWAEWDTALWLEEGAPGPQLTALRALLSSRTLDAPAKGEPAPLLAAIQASRKGQAELSQELGERVRRAVELLIQEHGPAIEVLVENEASTPQAVYIAATRIIMRMVVILFAEARDLLPRDNRVYHASYGLQGLREELERAGSGAARARLRHRFGAWPRVLSLFRLVHEGSHHSALPIPRYGGALFAPGDPRAADPLQAAIAALEDPEHAPNDAVVLQIFHDLCRCRVKVRQGRGATWVEAPVDFSDLSSEYIGILYEGLLDFELRQATHDDPMVFLALGDEPVLPLSRLEAMDDKDLNNLVDKLKVKNRGKAASEEADEQSDEDATAEEVDEEEADQAGEDEPEIEASAETAAEVRDEADGDARRAARARALQWARRAVIAGKLVPKPRSRKAAAAREHEEKVNALAERLIRRVMLPGEWFLVRWGGTRKGAGTFYTRPQLAVPTTRRTLEPLVYGSADGDGGDGGTAEPGRTPKPPEQILALKICDPAMGSGSFLVAALRYLTDALYASLLHHGRIQRDGERSIIRLINGGAEQPSLSDELLPCPPDADDFEPRLRALLKRYVVERCIYGVDFDPLAVELGRLALWVETMDRDLPFEFLDHKLKCGNSLVGCWFDRFRDYPALAWEREGGDKNHNNGVHFEKNAWTKAIKEIRNQAKTELPAWVAGQSSLLDAFNGKPVEAIHAEAIRHFEELHRIPVQDAEERSRFYRDKIQGDQAVQALKQAFDTWTACWFWPAEQLSRAPLPRTFEQLPDESRAVVEQLAREHRFFHWELEFPDVFDEPGAGFSAMLGNPPWDIQKPSSKEFFSNLDPLYRTYGKQDALHEQTDLFSHAEEHERDWLRHNAHFKAMSNWCKNAGSPFGDGQYGGTTFSFGRGNKDTHRRWAALRARRKGFADQRHPYIHQGSADINTYKMFLELSHALLASGGQLGMIAPSGTYTDKGTTELRKLFLEQCRWRWLFGFENREGIFDIHRSFKFGPLILEKGGETEAIRTAFMHRRLEDWEAADDHAIPYARAQVQKFSPKTRAILEIRHKRDLEILEKIYANSVLLGDTGPDGWGIQYTREFDMTNDSHLFKPRPWWEDGGYKPDVYGRWIGPEGDIALPLYEGRMIGQFDFSEKGWVSGRGRSAVWREIPWASKSIEPQYCMSCSDYVSAIDREGNPKAVRGLKVAFMDVTSATNSRTMIASVVGDVPCGNSAPVLDVSDPSLLLCILNSFAYDFVARARCGGLHLNYFVIEETPLVKRPAVAKHLLRSALALTMPSACFAPEWYRHLLKGLFLKEADGWKYQWAVTPHERLRQKCIIDAIVAFVFGLNIDDLSWILKGCAHPKTVVMDRNQNEPKGFWRVDKDQDPELRQTVLTIAALSDLQEIAEKQGGHCEKAIDAFCSQNGGEGWMIPEVLCLDEFALGQDDPRESRPVRARLGPRHYDWQLERSPEESWAECEIHARNILGEDEYARLITEQPAPVSLSESGEPQEEVSGNMIQRSLL